MIRNDKYLPIELGDPISKLWLFKHNLKLYDICPLLLGSENALTHSPILFFCRGLFQMFRRNLQNVKKQCSF